MKYSSNPFQIENKNSAAAKRNLDNSEQMVVDLTEDEFQDEKQGKGIIASCSLKKTKLVKTEDDLCQRTNFQENQSCVSISAKHNPSTKQERSGNTEITRDGLSSAVTAKKGNLQSRIHNLGAVSGSAPADDEEKRGSTFLSQVNYISR